MASRMNIYSWNVLFRNRELDRALAFIAQSDFDVFCLQEVSEEFLKCLRTLPCHIAHTIEGDLTFGREHTTIFSIILSKHPIINSHEISLAYYAPGLKRRFIAWFMYKLRMWAEVTGNRHALFADIETSERDRVRVFNLHLPLMHPDIRAEEFELVLMEHDLAQSTVVCGDFNILESPLITILNWLFGGRARDALFYRRERTRIEEQFATHGLHNALRGKVTYPLARSQLDHILVSRSFSIKNATVIPDRFGSDHHPICVELT